jgi:hypothetical protein
MITPLQVKKALSMRASGMTFAAIADVIGEELDPLVAAIEEHTGRKIPRALAHAGDPQQVITTPKAGEVIIAGYAVEFDAAPPPAGMRNLDPALVTLIDGLKPGAKVRAIRFQDMIKVRKAMALRGHGVEWRLTDKENKIGNLWVTAELTALQVRMKEVHRKVAADGVKPGRQTKKSPTK